MNFMQIFGRQDTTTNLRGGEVGVSAANATTGVRALNVALYAADGATLLTLGGDIDGVDFSSAAAKSIGVVNANYLYSGSGELWDRARNASATNLALASKAGVAMVEASGHWSIQHEPAVATRATISRAAGGAGTRHICTGFSGSLCAVGAIAAPLYLRVRDGATGAGTILWSAAFILPAGDSRTFGLSGLSLLGSDNTAMTCEWSAAPAAGDFQSVSLSGFTTA